MLFAIIGLEKSSVTKIDQVNAMLACRVLSNSIAVKENGPLFDKHFSNVIGTLLI